MAELGEVLDEVKATPNSPFVIQVVIPERDIPDEMLRLAENKPPTPPKGPGR